MDKKVYFRDLPVGREFKFDGDTFVKTNGGTAWEIRRSEKYKEWAFMPNDKCLPINAEATP